MKNDKKYFLFTKLHKILRILRGKKAPKYPNMDIWVVGTSNQLFIRGSYTETKFSKK